MKERGILMSGMNIAPIQADDKTHTRRIVKPQPNLIYRLTDDIIQVVHTNEGACDELDSVAEQCGITANSRISQFGLHGRKRWACVLTDEIQRLWSQGLRGLVLISWSQKREGVFECVVVPRKQKGDETRSSADMHGFPWNAGKGVYASSPLGRRSTKQSSGESCVGNAARELAGQEGARTWNRGGEASCSKADGRGTFPSEVGNFCGALQPTSRGENPWDEPIIHLGYSKFEVGTKLWVREAWRTESDYYNDLSPSEMSGEETILYEADGDWSANKTVGRYRHARFMPRWASRIDLEITEIRVERLQDISEADAIAEGCFALGDCECTAVRQYRELWEKINGPGSWDLNPFCWVIIFRRIK